MIRIYPETHRNFLLAMFLLQYSSKCDTIGLNIQMTKRITSQDIAITSFISPLLVQENPEPYLSKEDGKNSTPS